MRVYLSKNKGVKPLQGVAELVGKARGRDLTVKILNVKAYVAVYEGEAWRRRAYSSRVAAMPR